MGTTSISQQRIDQIRDYYASGMSIHDIMVKVGVSRDTIYRHVSDQLRNPNSGRQKVSPEMIEQMKQMRSNGKSNSKIAKELGLSETTVVKYIGLQPTGCRADYGSIVAHVTDVKPDEVTIEAPKQSIVPKTELKLKNVVYLYAGSHYEYKVRTDANVVRIVDNGNTFDIPTVNFESFVLELVELYSELSSKKIVLH